MFLGLVNTSNTQLYFMQYCFSNDFLGVLLSFFKSYIHFTYVLYYIDFNLIAHSLFVSVVIVTSVENPTILSLAGGSPDVIRL